MVRSPLTWKNRKGWSAHFQEAPGPGQNDTKVVHLLPMLLELFFRLFLGDAVSLLDFEPQIFLALGAKLTSYRHRKENWL
jgi:hypothetical protein